SDCIADREEPSWEQVALKLRAERSQQE
ncbi:hypothetical protein A2U01_0118411, partial [Trifolium medium]|nr:hypothetical protein [Trifolium medium]